jgi:predicted ABC-type ATPase
MKIDFGRGGKKRMKMKRRSSHVKKIVIIAGPNGAGKTTFAQEFLPREAGCPDFINADLIARGLSPFAPEKVALQAGKIMLDQMARKIRRGDNSASTPILIAAGDNP